MLLGTKEHSQLSEATYEALFCGIFHFTLRLHRAPQKSYHLLVPWGFREHLLSPSVLGDQWRCVREGHSCKEVFASTV